MPSPAEATPASPRRPINIGLAIRIARQFNRLSQRDVVRASGISQGVCSEYESGRKHPSPENLDAIADALHMSPATLYLLAEHLAERDSETPMRHLASIKRWLADTAHVERKDTP
jgi:transcriptional regulator with XRE-family HTH domain